ncbi:MAG: calcium-binding protein [Sulfitobacter sp.]
MAGQVGTSSTAAAISVGVAIAMNEISNRAEAYVEGADVTVTGDQDGNSLVVQAETSAGPSFDVLGTGLTEDKLKDAAEVDLAEGNLDNNVEGDPTTEEDDVIVDAADAAGDAVILQDIKDALNSVLVAPDLITGTLRVSQSALHGWVAVAEDGRSFNLQIDGGTLKVERASINAVSIAAAISVSVSPSSASVAVSGAGAYSENVITSKALAHIDGSTIDATGDVVVDADNASTINASVLAASLAVSVSGSTGVGVSIGVAIARNFIGQDRNGDDDAVQVHAYLLDSSVISSAGDVAVTADAAQSIHALTFAGAAAVSGGSTGVAISGSGVWNENTVNVDVRAAIDGDASTGRNAAQGDVITVAAMNASEIAALAGAAAVSVAFGSTGVAVSIGLGLAQNIIGGVVEARIQGAGDGVVARTGNVSVTAEDSAEIEVLAAAASIAAGFGSTGVAVSGAGAEATNRLNTTTRAHLTNSTVTATLGDVIVDGRATGDIDAVVIAASAAVAVGSTGVGASIGVAVARNLIGYDQALVATTNTTADTIPQLTKNVTSVTIEAGARTGDSYLYIGDTVTQADNVIDDDDNTAPYALSAQDFGNNDLWKLINLDESRAVVEAAVNDSVVTARDAVVVDARSVQGIKARTISGSVAVAGGSTGIAVSGSGAAVENRIATDVSAHVSGSGTVVTADNVTINADDISIIDAISAALSISAAFGQTGVAVSIGISVAINNIATNVAAYADTGAQITTSGAGGTTISASTPELLLGGSNAPSVVSAVNATQLNDAGTEDMTEDGDENEIPDAADALADAVILSSLKSNLNAQGFGLIGDIRVSTVEESGSWTVIDAEGTAVALQKNGATINATRANINAVSGAAALAVAAGQIGVGIAGAGAVALNAIQTNVQAYADTATVVATGEGDVVIDARSESEINASVLAVAASVAVGQVGVGVGIGISVARNFIGRDLTGDPVADAGQVSAFARNSSIDAQGDLSITADSAQSIRALTFAGAVAVAGGQVGVGVAGAGVYAENVIDATTQAFIDGDGATGVRADSVTVTAKDTSQIDAVGAAVAISAGFGMVGVAVSAGISIGFNEIGSDVHAFIANADTVVESRAGDITVDADNTATIQAASAAAAVAVSAGLVGVSFAGAGAFAENEITTTTKADITGSVIDANGGGDVIVLADGSVTIDALILSTAVAFGAGAVGLGVSVGVSLAENRIGNGDTSGVFAQITNSTVTAEGAVTVEATMDESNITANVIALSVAIAGGVVGGAAAGSGSDAINEIDYAVIADISNSTITAVGDQVRVAAEDNSVINAYVGAASVAGSVGFVGGSVAIAISLSENTVDNTVSATVTNTDVTAGSLIVNADDQSRINGTSEAAALAASISLGFAVAGSGASVQASNTSRTSAKIIGVGNNDLINLTGNLTVNAIARPQVIGTAGTASVSVGLAALAASGGVVNVTAAPTVEASISAITVQADDVFVTAEGKPHAKGFAYGMSVSTGLSMGANDVRATSTPIVLASAGGTYIVDDLTIRAKTSQNGSLLNADSYAESSAGGLLLGATSTFAKTTARDNVSAALIDNTQVISTGHVTIDAGSALSQYANANSAAIGLIGAGASTSIADSNTTIAARLGASARVVAETLSVLSTGTANNTADTTAGSGGLVAGSAAAPTTTTRANVSSIIGDAATVTLGDGLGLLTVSAAHTANPNTFVVTDSFGLIGGSGAKSNNTIAVDVTTRLGDQDGDAIGADITARSANLAATSTVVKAAAPLNNIDGDAGGLASGAEARSLITIDLATIVDIDDHSTLVTTDGAGTLKAKAFNALDVTDDVALFTAGAVSGAGAYIDLVTPQLLAQVEVGADALIDAGGELVLESSGEFVVDLHSKSETYGIGTVAIGHAKMNIAPDNLIDIYGTVVSDRDAWLSAGTDRYRNIVQHELTAYVDNIAGSAIPIDDLETEVIIIADNTIHVHAGGLLQGNANIALIAEEVGTADIDVLAKGVNWVSVVGDAVDAALGGNNANLGPGDATAKARGSVINDGTVRTGQERQKALTITVDDVTGAVTGTSTIGDGTGTAIASVVTYTLDPIPTPANPNDAPDVNAPRTYTRTDNGVEEAITFTVSQELVETARLAQYNLAQKNLTEYGVKVGADNPVARAKLIAADPTNTEYYVNFDLVKFYQAQVVRLQNEMLAAGEAVWYDVNNNSIIDDGELLPQLPTVQLVTVDPVFAQAGEVEVLADQLYGTGIFDTPRDSKIDITNNSNSYLRILGAEIPISNGGVFFNGRDMSVEADPLARIYQENLLVNEFDNGVFFIWAPITPNVSFSAASLAVSGGAPEINIVVAYDAVAATLGTNNLPKWPDIIVDGDVTNERGSVLIDNNSAFGSSTGSVFLNATVTGEDVTVLSGDTIYINGTQSNTSGDPFAKWKTSSLTGNNFANRTAGTLNAGAIPGAIDAFLNPVVEQTVPSVQANRIIVDAEYFNVNGLIQAGKADFVVELNADTQAEIKRLRESNTGSITILPTTNPDFQIYYDPAANNGKGAVLVTPLTPGGGYVDIKANVVNTRNGKIVVYGGYPEIEIKNLMTFSDADAPELIIQGLDATTRGEGELIIKDLAMPETLGVPYTTIYQVNADGVVELSDNGGGFNEVEGKEFEYKPLDGLRYGWIIAQGVRETLVEEWTESDWLGIDAFSPDSRAPDKFRATPGTPTLVPDSNYFYLDVAKDGTAYTYDNVEVIGNVDGPKLSDKKEWSTWYGSNHAWFQYTTITDSVIYYSHTIEADREIDIEFIGYDTGSIVVEGGNSDVLVQGSISNAFGDTEINTTGTLRTSSTGLVGQIGGRTIDLSASSIGKTTDPLRVNLSGVEGVIGQRFDATATSGKISVIELLGDLAVGTVTANSGGSDISLTAEGSITRAAGAHLVQGDAITLVSESGSIGGGATNSEGAFTDLITIDTGDRARSSISAYAESGGIHLSEEAGNLRVYEILAGGDVTVQVQSGDLLDGNTIEIKDERAISELQNSVWGALNLTDETNGEDTGAASQKVQDTKDALIRAKTDEYKAYWNVRTSQLSEREAQLRDAVPAMLEADILADLATWHLTFRTADAMFDENVLLTFSAEEQAYYENFYTEQAATDVDVIAGTTTVQQYVEAAILTLKTSRTVQYRAIDAVWGSDGGADGDVDTFDRDYKVELSDDEVTNIDASIKIWTEDELINAIGGGLLKPVTDTDVVIENENIIGSDITLDVSGKIGRSTGQVLIAIDPDVELTKDERLTLAGAERDDVFFLTTELFAATVDFNAAAGTITRTDGGTWSTDLAGQVIQVEGTSSNATEEGPFYTVLSVVGGVITLDQADEVLSTGEILKAVKLTGDETMQAVTISGIALDPKGISAEDAVVTITGGNTITRTGGTVDFSNFKTGMKILLSGDETENGNDAATLYTVMSAIADTIVLSGTPGLIGEMDITLDVNQFVELFAVQVQLREDFDIISTGTLTATAGGQSFIGSEAALALNLIDVNGDLRIRAQGAISDNRTSTTPNITSDDLLLEAGDGGIGEAGHIFINQSTGSGLTARAGGSISITETAGDMRVSTIFSRSDINLVAQRSILDHIGTNFVNIQGDSLFLTAQTGSIGEIGDALEIELTDDGPDAKGVLTATALGDIVVTEQFGDLNIRNVLSTAGNVVLEAAVSIFDAVDLVDPTAPATSDEAATGTAQLEADVLAHGDITLTARLGFIGAFGNELDIDSRRSGTAGLVTTQSEENTYLIEQAGDMWLNSVGVNPADAMTTAYLTATVGGIFNGAPVGASNVTGGRAYLIAQSDIGTALKPLFTEIGTIQTLSTFGSTYVTNDGALEVAVLDSTAGYGQRSGGEVSTTASSPITVASDILAAGDITLTASESAPEDYDILTVNADISVISSGGDITLRAGDHIVVSSGALVDAVQGDISFTSDFNDIGTGGGDITVTGAVNAGGQIAFATGVNSDVVTITGSLTAGQNIAINTGATRDFVTVSGDLIAGTDIAVDLEGGNDVFTLTGGFAAGDTILISAGSGADTVLLDDATTFTGFADILGGTGDDVITVVRLLDQNRADDSLLIDGGAGSDDVFIQTHGSISGIPTDYVIDAFDSGAPGEGADTMVVSGTTEDDNFLSRAGFVALLHGTDAQIRGVDAGRPDTVERINYDRSTNGRVTLVGLDGNDGFVSDDNSAIMTFDGGAGNDSFQFGQIFGIEPVAGNGNGIAEGDDIAAVLTTRGWLSNGASFATVAFGGTGNDSFTVYANRAEVKLEGEAGNDEFIVRAFLLETGGNTIQGDTEVLAGDGDDTITYNINAPVNIDGGAGFDTVIVLGTEGDDHFVISEDGIFGAGLNVRISNTEESVEVDGLEGDDTFYILSTAAGAVTNVIGGLGSDTFDVTGDVTGQIISADLEGRSGLVNHQVTSDDDDYDQTFAAGLGTTIADPVQGAVIIGQSASGDLTPGETTVSELEGQRSDIYTVVLATAPVTGTVYITVSANRASTEDKALAVPQMGAGTGLSFSAGGNSLTRDSGSWIDEGFDVYQSITVTDAGDDNGTYEIADVTATTLTLVQTFTTTQAGLTTAAVTGQQADSVLVSADGTSFADAIVLEFTADNWDIEQSVTILAVDDAASEGNRNVVISHSVIAEDATFDGAQVNNIEVMVEDNDLAGVRIIQSDLDTFLLEGTSGITDTWDVVLTRAPDAGETVTVTLSDNSNSGDLSYSESVLTFTAANWNDAQTVTVTATANDGDENEERIQVTHTLSTDGARYATAVEGELDVTVIDGDTAGVVIRETDGNTLIVDRAGEIDTYTMRLTKAPTDDVTVNISEDGQTRIVAGGRVSLATLAAETVAVSFVRDPDGPDYIERSSGTWAAAGFGSGQTVDIAGTASNDGTVLIGAVSENGRILYLSGGLTLKSETVTADLSVTVGQVTFTTANWAEEVTIVLEADPDFEPDAMSYVTKVFPAEEHTTSKIRGSLSIQGGPAEDRLISKAVMLPTESDPGPIALDIVTDETIQNDRVNIFNDGDVTGTPGRMTTTTLPGGEEALLIDGLNMGSGVNTFDEGDILTGPILVDYAKGITIQTVEIVDVLLGSGDDVFEVLDTNRFSDNLVDLPVTAIHGGAGADHITITGGAGPESLLVVYGDTTTDGSRYNYLGGAPTGGGLVFDGYEAPEDHGDIIDASGLVLPVGASVGLVIDGGIGADVIYGSTAGDHIAGGSGNDTIFGGDGADHIYGDSGFVVELAKRKLTVLNSIIARPSIDSADTRMPGEDNIDGGAGDDIIFGDHGFIKQVAGTLRMATTEMVRQIHTTQLSVGENDTVEGGAGNDIVLTGLGADQITDSSGDNVLLGDHGLIDYASADGDISDIDLIRSTAVRLGGNDVITTADGSNIVIGGFGSDVITAQTGTNIIFGDAGKIVAAVTDAPQIAGLAMTLSVMRTFAPTKGAYDTVTTGDGASVIFGGAGADTITTGNGTNVVVGDHGLLNVGTGAGNLGSIPLELLTLRTNNVDVGSGDTITTGLGEDIVLGGAGGDTINTAGANGNSVADVILGDHGIITWLNTDDGSTDLARRIISTNVTTGGDDTITSGAGNDLIMGGTGADRILSGAGNDLVLGDHGKLAGDIDETALPLHTGTLPFDVTSIWTGASHGGAADWIDGGAGDDLILGQQGGDVIFGRGGDDDLIGGHNVDPGQIGELAEDGDDAIDGGSGDDVILGDNGRIYRSGTLLDARMQTLSGGQLYGTTGADDGAALNDGQRQNNVDGTVQRDIIIFDHSDTEDAREYGNDYIAGGSGDDVIFGQLGLDTIQGDGSIDLNANGLADNGLADTDQVAVGAARDAVSGLLSVSASIDDFDGEGADGDDYIEGNGGEDVIFGNLGQDDIIGGSSSLYPGLNGDESARPDGSDLLFGGSGTAIARNDLGDQGIDGHARDADVIVGDNGNIVRIVGTDGISSGAYLGYNYDIYGGEKIIVRAVDLLDYTEGGVDFDPAALNDNGAGDEIHGEAGDDSIYGMTGSDVIYGDGQNDDIIGGWGHEWISGGTGSDGVIGDDGRIMTSRNSTTIGESLHGIEALASVNDLITAPNANTLRYTINVDQQLKKSVNLTPFNVDPSATQDKLFVPTQADDIIYGGWGDDFLHGGSGDDAISGAEALPLTALPQAMDGTVISWDTPFNPGGLLAYDSAVEEFAHYDEDAPRTRVDLNGGTFFLNFDASEGPVDVRSQNGLSTDGDDVIFGDLGNDALMGGTGRDRLYGGYGSDWLNLDDDLSTTGGTNDDTDTDASYEDYALGGAGRDVLIANTGGDRMHDWTGEFNSFIVPFKPFGAPTVIRSIAPSTIEFWYDLSASDGADPTRAADTGSDPARNGEPDGELGIVRQSDADWGDQHGGPADPQPGNGPASRDVRVSSAPGAKNDAASGTADYGVISATTLPSVGDGGGDIGGGDTTQSTPTTAARPTQGALINAIENSEIQLSFHPSRADRNIATSSYVFDADLGEFVQQSFVSAAGAPADAAYTMLDDDGELFAYVDSAGALWVIDDLTENPGGYADDEPDDWIFQADYQSRY